MSRGMDVSDSQLWRCTIALLDIRDACAQEWLLIAVGGHPGSSRIEMPLDFGIKKYESQRADTKPVWGIPV
jgi:hypothetical protein